MERALNFLRTCVEVMFLLCSILRPNNQNFYQLIELDKVDGICYAQSKSGKKAQVI